MKRLIIATRGSKLALWQSEHIQEMLESHYPDMDVELKVMKTKGDKVIDTPLAKIGGKGLFTKELEDAMLRGEAHIAVHSLKDVPVEFLDGLKLVAITKRDDPRDAFLSEKYAKIEDLPKNAVVGTTSLRRRMQVLLLRPDLKIKNLRGNINTRIKKLKDGEYDAIILASVGISRLKLGDIVKFIKPIDTEEMVPAMGQAALGIEIVDNEEVEEIVSVLEDQDTVVETTIERDFVEALDGGCQAPIGVNAKLLADKLEIKCIVGLPNGEEIIQERILSSKKFYKTIGKDLAKTMINKGARELLKRAEKIALEEIL